MSHPRARAVFCMARDLVPLVFPVEVLADLQALVDVDPDETITDFTAADPALLADVDVLVTGWEAPRLDAAVLGRMPRLRAVVHAGGSVKAHLDQQVWAKGIEVSSGNTANGLPVAEYTLAMILLAGKRTFAIAAEYLSAQAFVDVTRRYTTIGTYGLRVGLIGASAIGRRVLELLAPFDAEVLVYDPYVGADEIASLGARKAELDEVMSCTVVSIHAPCTSETERMVGAAQLALMPDGATLINTARGRLLDHDALVAELGGGRLHAVLDVTDPEPLPAGHPLYSLPNVMLTPHLAGSHGTELHRLGRHAVDEVGRLVRGEPLRHPVMANLLLTSA